MFTVFICDINEERVDGVVVAVVFTVFSEVGNAGVDASAVNPCRDFAVSAEVFKSLPNVDE